VPRIGRSIADSTSVARLRRDRLIDDCGRMPNSSIALVRSAAMDGRFVIFALTDERMNKDKAAVIADGRFGRGA
jgi:hypothetical protein